MIYVKNNRKIRETTTDVLEAASAASNDTMKKENVEGEVGSTESSTLSEDGFKWMKKLLQTTAPFYCDIVVDFKTLIEKNKLRGGENINIKLNFIIVEHPFDRRNIQNTDYFRYDLFALKHLQGINEDNKRRYNTRSLCSLVSLTSSICRFRPNIGI